MDFLAQARRQMLGGQLSDARERLLTAIEGLADDEMLLPGVAGEWSVRDILAHVAAWDRAVVEQFNALVAGERHPLLDSDEDGVQRFNEEHHAALVHLSPQEALSELNAARDELVETLKGYDNARLFAPAPGDEHADMSMAALLAVQVDHDEEHAEQIEHWREQRAEGQ